MRLSSWISSASAILGTLIPISIICILALFQIDFHSLAHFHLNNLIPNFYQQKDTLPYFVELLFGLIGIEISAAHADEVTNPAKTFPRATMISVIIIVSSLILASLAIAAMVPTEDLNVIDGVMQTARLILNENHLNWFFPVFGSLVILGSLGSLAAWVIGITKGVFVAAQDHFLPEFIAKENRYNAPYIILITQGIIFSALSISVIILPVQVAFVLLSAVTTQLSLIIYITLFYAAYILKKKRPNHGQYFKTPFIEIVCIIGSITSALTFFIGFMVPAELGYTSPFIYSFTILCIFIFAMLPPALGIWNSRKYYAQ
jgi:amino acid transporter